MITSERILRVFTITKLTHLFPIYASVEEAMAKASADRHDGPLHTRGRPPGQPVRPVLALL